MTKIAAGLLLSVALGCAQGIEGTWMGTLEAGTAKLRVALHISKDANGGLTTKLDSLDQGANGIPVETTTFIDNRLHLDMPLLHATYDGTLESNGEITGTFTQGAALPLTFTRIDKLEAPKRPQNPHPPFPYDAIEVSYENKPGGVTLAGTLTVPHGNGPFPAAILITGSGPQDRDETIFGHKPFWVIADYLTRRGLAVLRVDDRGVGKSTGNSSRATLTDAAGDVLSGVEFLKGRKDIDGKHIGVIGHSEGGIIGPLAASRSNDVAFVVMLAGTGVPGDQVLALQAEMVAKAAGASDGAIAANRAIQQKLIDTLRGERDENDENVIVEKLRDAWNQAKPKDAGKAADQMVAAQIESISSPEIRSFLFYDPAPVLRSLRVPVLALNGSRDIQVPPAQNVPAIAAALAAGGNEDFTVAELPGLNHLFQKCTACDVSEYGRLEETFSPTALEVMGDWIARHTR